MIEERDSIHFLLGNLDAKVGDLLAREKTNSTRIDTLERRFWLGLGAVVALLYMTGGHGFGELVKAFAG